MKYLICLVVFVLISCSDDAMVGSTAGDGNVTDIPIRYRSPISMYEHNKNTFEHLLYDSTGTTILSTDTTYIAVENVIDYVDTISLVEKYRFDTLDFYDNDQSYFYTYRWEHSNSGYIIAYYQADNEDTEQSGVIIVGKFNDSDVTLFDKPLLWIPYPITVTGNGDLLESNDVDSSSNYQFVSSSYEIPVDLWHVTETYCYRVGNDERFTYYYYEIGHGLVAAIEYRNGIRYKTLRNL